MSLPSAPLGKNGPQVSRLGFGLMGLSTFYGPPKPDNERLALLDQAYEMGERNWDVSHHISSNSHLYLE
jgi:aryl-alcohol dehydrogenase-like predicted oxidoreductase